MQGKFVIPAVRFRLLVVIVVLFTIGFTASGRTVAAQGTGAALASLTAKVQVRGRVPVILKLNVNIQPQSTLSRPQIIAQRNAIANTQTSITQSLAGMDRTNIKTYQFIPYIAMTVDSAALQALAKNSMVVEIYEDIVRRPTLFESTGVVGADTAWGLGYDGTGWVVAVLDTGVDKNHNFLSGKVISEACYSTTGSGATSLCPGGGTSSTATNSGLNCPATTDGCDHGTHVAGIVAGQDYTGGPGYNGVAKGANLIAIQVFSQFTGTDCTDAGVTSPCVSVFTSDEIAGLERVYALRSTYNIAAANLSLSGGLFTSNCDSEPEKAIIDLLRSAGIATVASSGNDGFINAMGAPACISTAISVGATCDDATAGPGGCTAVDDVAFYSNIASFISLLAPGSLISSSIPGTDTFASWDGTSMAAPHVAGAWAVLKQKDPTATVSTILAAFQNTGTNVDDVLVTGMKRINVDTALGQLTSPTTTTTTATTTTTGATTTSTTTATTTTGATTTTTAPTTTTTTLPTAVIPDQTCPDPVPALSPPDTPVCTITVLGLPENLPTAYSITDGNLFGAFNMDNARLIFVQNSASVTEAASPFVLQIMGTGGTPSPVFGMVTINVVAVRTTTTTAPTTTTTALTTTTTTTTALTTTTTTTTALTTTTTTTAALTTTTTTAPTTTTTTTGGPTTTTTTLPSPGTGEAARILGFQDGNTVSEVNINGGDLMLSTIKACPDGKWDQSDNSLAIAGEMGPTATVSSANFPPQDGTVVTAAVECSPVGTKDFRFIISGPLGSGDTDGDGIPDNQEPYDENNNGLADYLEDKSLGDNEIPLDGTDAGRGKVVTSDGTTLTMGPMAFDQNKPGVGVDEDDIENNETGGSGFALDGDVVKSCVGGCISIKVFGVTPGDSVKITYPLSIPILEGAVYRKYFPGVGWQDFDTTTGDTIRSAAKVAGNICPAPVHVAFKSGPTTGDGCIQLTIRDGGPNDTDGVINGIVVDPHSVSEFDITAPLITLIGTSQLTVTRDSNYVDQGATALDDHDGDVTSNIVTVNNVETRILGTYTITYNVTDSSGNAANTVTRSVVVQAQNSSSNGGSGCSISTTLVAPASRGDWWLLVVFLGLIRIAKKRKTTLHIENDNSL